MTPEKLKSGIHVYTVPAKLAGQPSIRRAKLILGIDQEINADTQNVPDDEMRSRIMRMIFDGAREEIKQLMRMMRVGGWDIRELHKQAEQILEKLS